MKKALLLIASIFLFAHISLQGQECQAVMASVSMTSPAISIPDSNYIDICVGDAVQFTGVGIYPENNMNYFQQDSTSLFEWYFGDGSNGFGQTIEHAFTEPGGFSVQLIVTDVMGCSSTNRIDLYIRVFGVPEVNFQLDSTLAYCESDTINIQANYENPDTLFFASSSGRSDSLALPDGTGASYQTSVFVSGYADGQVLTSVGAISSICVNIEHSWMRDLEIALICPNGNQVILHNFFGQTGAAIFLGEPNDDDGVNPIPGVGYTYCWTPDATLGTWLEYASALEGGSTLPPGNYNSFDPLDNFLGCPLNGPWSLRVLDLWGSDNGFIFNWSITFNEEVVFSQPPFNFEIVDAAWDTPNDFEVLESTATNLIAITGTTAGITLELTDNKNCVSSFNVRGDILEDGSIACQPCDSLSVDAGPDISSECANLFIVLENDPSLEDPFLEQTWYNSNGQPLTENTVQEPGQYILEVVNLLNGCSAQDTLEIILDQIEIVADAGPDAYFNCLVSSVTLGGENTSVGPGVTYFWERNGLPFATSPFIEVDQAGIYVLVVMDSTCFNTIRDTVVVYDRIILELLVGEASCDMADGTATVEILDQVNNPIIAWSTGDSNTQISGLAQGWYSVTVTDENGCTDQENFFVDEQRSCKVEISGYVYNDDDNRDCLADNPGLGEECVLLHLMPLDIYTLTDRTGFYEFVVDPGSYTVEIIPQAYFELLCPANPNFEVELLNNGGVSAENDFYLQYKDGVYDLTISAFAGEARPGFRQSLEVLVCNQSNVVVDAVATITLDSLISAFTGTPVFDNFDPATNTWSWNLNNFLPETCQIIDLDLSIPVDTELRTLLSYEVAVTPTELDVDVSNNFKNWQIEVIGSYDPNDKQVLTGENQFGGPISVSDSVLQYQVRFQNTGTASAITVEIRDTIDSNLDVTSIQPGLSSHDYEVKFEGRDVLIFRFDNINLPDSLSDPEGSQGYVIFTIELEDDLPFGTDIQNRAGIYFDFNKPIITNTVTNTLTDPIVNTVDENAWLEDIQFSLFPNPVDQVLSFEYHLSEPMPLSALLYNSKGEQVGNPIKINKSIGWHQERLDVASLSVGVYYLVIKGGANQQAAIHFVKVD